MDLNNLGPLKSCLANWANGGKLPASVAEEGGSRASLPEAQTDVEHGLDF